MGAALLLASVPSQASMEIHVRTEHNQDYPGTIRVDPGYTIGDLKVAIQSRTDLLPESQRLYCHGEPEPLKDDRKYDTHMTNLCLKVALSMTILGEYEDVITIGHQHYILN